MTSIQIPLGWNRIGKCLGFRCRGGFWVVGIDIDYHRGHIVASVSHQGEMNEGFDRLLAIVIAVDQQATDFLVAHGFVEAIAAEQEDIAGLQRMNHFIDEQLLR